jgi:lysozyme
MMLRISIILVTAILASFVMIYLYQFGYLRFNYPDRKSFPVRGIDISHHQDEIDWQLLTKQNVGFVYIKATEGGDFKDPLFYSNWKGASKSGIPRGAYHYFTFCMSGIEQAANFIRTVPAEANTLPPVINFEFEGNCNNRPTKEALLKDLRAFVEQIELAYGQSPIFYVTSESYNKYLDGEIQGYQIWIRDVFGYPTLSLADNWTFWQYADHARIKGIQGPVDLDVFNGSMQQLKELLKKQKKNSGTDIRHQ